VVKRTVRRRASAWSLALALGGVNAACGGYRPDPPPRSAPKLEPTAIAGTPLTLLWSGQGPHDISEPLAVVDSSLYVGGGGRQVAKIDLRGGAVIWSQRVGGPIAGGVLYHQGRVYAATDQPEGKLRAWTEIAGNEIWSQSTGPVNAPLAIVNDLLLVHTRQGGTLALDPVTGDSRWHARTSAGLVAVIPGVPGQLIVPSLDTLYRLDAATGKVLQRQAAPGSLIYPLAVRDSFALGVTADGILFQLRTADLSIAWRLALHAVPAGPPLIIGDSLVTVSRIGKFYRAQVGDTAPAAAFGDSAAPVTAGPVAQGDLLLIGGADGALSARDQSGHESWRLAVRRPLEVAPIPLPTGLLIIGGNGDIHRFRL
jgi:outer membrane protein assembly factor BamB